MSRELQKLLKILRSQTKHPCRSSTCAKPKTGFDLLPASLLLAVSPLGSRSTCLLFRRSCLFPLAVCICFLSPLVRLCLPACLSSLLDRLTSLVAVSTTPSLSRCSFLHIRPSLLALSYVPLPPQAYNRLSMSILLYLPLICMSLYL